MYKQITIKTLKQQGKANTIIAEELGCHRNTVNNILNRKEIIEKQRRNKLSYFDKYKIKIKEWIDSKYTRLRIYEVLSAEYSIDRTYDSMCKYIQKEFPKTKEAFGVQTTEAGFEAEIDFGYLGMFPNNFGGLSKVYILIIVLTHSRIAYYHLCQDQKMNSLLDGCKKAFEYFGGVPIQLKVDNMKTAILHNQHYDLQFNQDFLEFSYHYGFIIKPCEPYSPNQKGKVESAVKYVERNFVIGRNFKNRSDMEMQLRTWMIEYANNRIHGTTKFVPKEVFNNKEKSKLQKLPENEFLFFERGTRIVKTNCHINFNQNYYSVPSSFVDKEVTIRWNSSLLRIINESEEIALHNICKGKGEYITVRSHLPQDKYYSQTEYQTKYEMKMADIGDYSHKYFTQLLIKKSKYWFRTVRYILRLVEMYGEERVNLTLKRALDFGIDDIPTITNICEKQTYQMNQAPKLEVSAITDSLSRDISYYSQVMSS